MKFTPLFIFICVGLNAGANQTPDLDKFKTPITDFSYNTLSFEVDYMIELCEIYDDYFDLKIKGKQTEEKHGFASDKYKKYMSEKASFMEKSSQQLDAIIAKIGWPGIDKVGKKANIAAYYILQEADLEKQLATLPLVQASVEEDNTPSVCLAYLVDRISLRQGQSQIYGTQIMRNPKTGEYQVAPIENKADLNFIREGLDLIPMKDYVKQWGIDWK